MNTEFIEQLYDRLFPICRSITGPGIRQSLEILQEFIPINIEAVATGTPVFDWHVPQEWQLNKAELKTVDGETIVSTDDNNLHVLNFSIPFKGRVSKAELDAHLYSKPDYPEAIPYVTSYYKERWGFCLSEQQRQSLPDCDYMVDIDTHRYDGALNYGECFLEGDSTDTILLSTYLCHPSMANNELSGPLVLTRLYQELSQLDYRRYSYRFVIVPETIGSIAYLARNANKLDSSIIGGIVLTCLGGPNRLVSFKLSRRDWLGEPSPIDRFARYVSGNLSEDFRIRDFTPTSGSDERQFCSPGINWPVIQAAKTVYGDFQEYHTHLDNKQFMRISAVEDSVRQIHWFIRQFEQCDLKLISTIAGGEPHLGRYDLYPTMNGPMTNTLSSDNAMDLREQLNLILNTLSLSDGSFTVTDIASKLQVSLYDLSSVIDELTNKGLLRLERCNRRNDEQASADQTLKLAS